MSICQRLAIEHPIIQAPMVGVSTPALAAAVSNAGGLGSVGLGASTPAQAREVIAQLRGLSDRPFNVNLFCHRPAQADPTREAGWLEHLRPLFAELGSEPPPALREIYRSFVDDPQMLELLLEVRPPVVSFHFGLPEQRWIDQLKAAGITLLACATSLDEARAIEASGVDAVIAQGYEAGGHRGIFNPEHDDRLGTLALVGSLVPALRVPVIAAGGIMDGRGIRAALALGAEAVQMGTAFVACPESSANAAYRAALRSDKAWHTQVTAAISGRPARGLVNRLFTDIGGAHAPALPGYPQTYDATKALLAAAQAKGNGDFAVQWAGQGAPLARELPASELMAALVAELQG